MADKGSNHDVEQPDFILKCPFTMCVVGSTGCGKTTFLKNLVHHSRERYSTRPGRFFYFYNIWQPAYREMQKSKADMEFIQGVPDLNWLEDNIDADKNCSIIIDDQASNFNKDLIEMFSVFSHHCEKLISIIHIPTNTMLYCIADSTNLIFVVHNLFGNTLIQCAPCEILLIDLITCRSACGFSG